jgi:hypothetical protein
VGRAGIYHSDQLLQRGLFEWSSGDAIFGFALAADGTPSHEQGAENKNENVKS